MLKELLVNIPLVESLEQMLGYVKFMKDLVTNKRIVRFETVDNVHHCSAIDFHSIMCRKRWIVGPLLFCALLGHLI